MDARPSGWYDDPEQPSILRYWDGSAWTDRTNPKAPMPAPQPPKAPVTRLRPSREERAAEATRSASPGTEQVRTGTDSPRPWNAGGRVDASHEEPGASTDADARPRARFMRRLIALILDYVILTVVFSLLLLAARAALPDAFKVFESWGETVRGAVEAGRPVPTPSDAVLALGTTMTMAFAALLVLYDFVLTQLMGATIGGRLLGMQVVRDGEGHLHPGRLLARAVLKHAFFVAGGFPGISSLGMAFALVDITWPLTDRRRRTLHERWSRTRTVLRRGEATTR